LSEITLSQLFTNDELDALRSVAKKVTDPKARWSEKRAGIRQRNHTAVSDDNSHRYRLYLRDNLNDKSDFSCGLALLQKGGKPVSLVRYNGANHLHGNIHYRCHIHRATAEALMAGKKIDSHAQETHRYRTLEGAMACLIEDCNVQGLTAKFDQPELFDEP